MKKVSLLLMLLLLTFVSNAQKFDDYEDIKLKSDDDFYATEDKVIECSSYILTCKLEDPSQSRKNAVNFLLRWAMSAPYDFVIEGWAASMMKKNSEFLTLQLAALVKFQLENKEASAGEIQLGAATLVYNYIKDPQFRIEQKGYIKKFVAAGDAGTLAEFISE